jgi:hypothetical protein
MVNKKKVAAVVAIGTGLATIAFTLKSRESFELMHKAAEDFLQNFPWYQNGLHADPPAIIPTEPYRTHFLIYSASAIDSGITSIGSSIYATKDYIVKGLKPLYNSEKKIIDGLLKKRGLTPEDFIYLK